jgi:DNA-binding MarR family transcriptional regulator
MTAKETDVAETLAARVPCALFNLRRATRTVTQLFDEILRPTGLKGTQYSMLRAIGGVEPVPISALGEAMGMDRTTVTRNVRVLERLRLVVVEAGTDRRTRLLRLSVTGRRAVEAAKPYWEEAQEAVVRGLGEEPFRDLREKLTAVSEVSRHALESRGSA